MTCMITAGKREQQMEESLERVEVGGEASMNVMKGRQQVQKEMREAERGKSRPLK